MVHSDCATRPELAMLQSAWCPLLWQYLSCWNRSRFRRWWFPILPSRFHKRRETNTCWYFLRTGMSFSSFCESSKLTASLSYYFGAKLSLPSDSRTQILQKHPPPKPSYFGAYAIANDNVLWLRGQTTTWDPVKIPAWTVESPHLCALWMMNTLIQRWSQKEPVSMFGGKQVSSHPNEIGTSTRNFANNNEWINHKSMHNAYHYWNAKGLFQHARKQADWFVCKKLYSIQIDANGWHRKLARPPWTGAPEVFSQACGTKKTKNDKYMTKSDSHFCSKQQNNI